MARRIGEFCSARSSWGTGPVRETRLGRANERRVGSSRMNSCEAFGCLWRGESESSTGEVERGLRGNRLVREVRLGRSNEDERRAKTATERLFWRGIRPLVGSRAGEVAVGNNFTGWCARPGLCDQTRTSEWGRSCFGEVFARLRREAGRSCRRDRMTSTSQISCIDISNQTRCCRARKSPSPRRARSSYTSGNEPE